MPHQAVAHLARIAGCCAFARYEHLAPPIDRDHGRSGALPRAPGTIVGVQLGEAVTVAQDRQVIAIHSAWRRLQADKLEAGYAAAVAGNPHYPYESAEEAAVLRARRRARQERDTLT